MTYPMDQKCDHAVRRHLRMRDARCMAKYPTSSRPPATDYPWRKPHEMRHRLRKTQSPDAPLVCTRQTYAGGVDGNVDDLSVAGRRRGTRSRLSAFS